MSCPWARTGLGVAVVLLPEVRLPLHLWAGAKFAPSPVAFSHRAVA